MSEDRLREIREEDGMLHTFGGRRYVCCTLAGLLGANMPLGVKKSYTQDLIQSKSYVAKLLLEKFRKPSFRFSSAESLYTHLPGAVAGRMPVAKINYKNFSRMTNRYGIVYENWPLEQFCCPGSINSMPELEVLKNAFESGAARFRKLGFAELEAWRKLQSELLAAERESFREGPDDGELDGASRRDALAPPSLESITTPPGSTSRLPTPTPSAPRPRPVRPSSSPLPPPPPPSPSATTAVPLLPLLSATAAIPPPHALSAITASASSSTGFSVFSLNNNGRGKRKASSTDQSGASDSPKKRKKCSDASVKCGPNKKTLERLEVQAAGGD